MQTAEAMADEDEVEVVAPVEEEEVTDLMSAVKKVLKNDQAN